MPFTANLSRRNKHRRRTPADRRRQARANQEFERRKVDGRRYNDMDNTNFAYHGT